MSRFAAGVQMLLIVTMLHRRLHNAQCTVMPAVLQCGSPIATFCIGDSRGRGGGKKGVGGCVLAVLLPGGLRG